MIPQFSESCVKLLSKFKFITLGEFFISSHICSEAIRMKQNKAEKYFTISFQLISFLYFTHIQIFYSVF